MSVSHIVKLNHTVVEKELGSVYSRLQNDRQVEKSQTGQARMPKPSEFALPVIALVTYRDL